MFGLRAIMFGLVCLAVALTAASPMEKFNKLGYLKPVNTLEETYDDSVLDSNAEAPTTPIDTTTDAATDTPTDATTDTPTDSTTDTPTDTPTDAPTDAPTDNPTTTPSVAPTTTSGSSAVYCSLVLVISSLFLL